MPMCMPAIRLRGKARNLDFLILEFLIGVEEDEKEVEVEVVVVLVVVPFPIVKN